MIEPSFHVITSMTSGELAVAFVVMRDPAADLGLLSERLARWFNRTIERTDVLYHVHRMLERDWLEPRDEDPACYRLTLAGEQVTFAAFGGVARTIDNDEGRWAIGHLWSAVSAATPEDFRRAIEDARNEEDEDGGDQ